MCQMGSLLAPWRHRAAYAFSWNSHGRPVGILTFSSCRFSPRPIDARYYTRKQGIRTMESE